MGNYTYKHIKIKEPKVIDESKIYDVPMPKGMIEKAYTARAMKLFGKKKK
ncbi:MAG: hypothetical protein ISQ22_07850 [Rhizobiales bacterium]|jgi:hypothetical protein|nr:hypothetical protein [Hyphomicrobiales bacterium]